MFKSKRAGRVVHVSLRFKLLMSAHVWGPNVSPLLRGLLRCSSHSLYSWSNSQFTVHKKTEMGFGIGALRTLIRPLSRTLTSRTSTPTPFSSTFTSPKTYFGIAGPVHRQAPWFPISNHFHSLTDTRFPKRRPADKSRRKRAGMKPPGSFTNQ